MKIKVNSSLFNLCNKINFKNSLEPLRFPLSSPTQSHRKVDEFKEYSASFDNFDKFGKQKSSKIIAKIGQHSERSEKQKVKKVKKKEFLTQDYIPVR